MSRVDVVVICVAQCLAGCSDAVQSDFSGLGVEAPVGGRFVDEEELLLHVSHYAEGV